jgi:2-hydroxychromene-2-carboxylate isomerase
MTLQFWFKFGSTYSYPAAVRIKALTVDPGVTVAWWPLPRHEAGLDFQPTDSPVWRAVVDTLSRRFNWRKDTVN